MSDAKETTIPAVTAKLEGTPTPRAMEFVVDFSKVPGEVARQFKAAREAMGDYFVSALASSLYNLDGWPRFDAWAMTYRQRIKATPEARMRENDLILVAAAWIRRQWEEEWKERPDVKALMQKEREQWEQDHQARAMAATQAAQARSLEQQQLTDQRRIAEMMDRIARQQQHDALTPAPKGWTRAGDR